MLFVIVSMCVLLISPVSADTKVTIAAEGDQSYYLGEKIALNGQNSDSDSTYLYITGPGIPDNGGKLTSPLSAVVSKNPDSFTVVKTNPDNTWEYSFYTANLPFDAGTYTIFAAAQPEIKNPDDSNSASTGLIIKKPFIIAELSSPSVSKGEPFTVSGVAEGIPESVQIWILGSSYYSKAVQPVSSDASFSYEVSADVTGNLESGQNFLIVQHPMMNNLFNVDVSEDYVCSIEGSDAVSLFRISGTGSLQGSEAADALADALSRLEGGDKTYSNDTYTLVPFMITGEGEETPEESQTSFPQVLFDYLQGAFGSFFK
ncbi:MAG: hypothetical protein PHV39_01930 [Methanomicrobium sp.]|nr:hypothetical protein [Methanomicrobium sp.]